MSPKQQGSRKSSINPSVTIPSSDTFTLSFDGGNDVDAGLLGLTISNMAFVVNQIASDDIARPECQLKVSAFKKGSFEIWFAVGLIACSQLSQAYTLSDASMVFNLIKGVFDIKKSLKGEKPEKVILDENEGTVHVLCADGTEVIAPLGAKIVIDKPAVSRKISEISQAIQQHNPEGGFTLIGSDEEVHYDHQAVEEIALLSPATEFGPTEINQRSEVTLPIRKVDLLGKAAWSFVYGQRTITASIEDRQFLQNVHSGKSSYKAGDKLTVQLTTSTKLAGDGTPTSESYTIDKVINIIPSVSYEGEQTKF